MSIQICWNENLMVEFRTLKNRMDRTVAITSLVYLLLLAIDALFCWQIGDYQNAMANAVVGTCALVAFNIGIQWFYFIKHRQLRRLPVVILTEEQIRIGPTVLNRADISKISRGRQRSKRRWLSVAMPNGQAHRIYIPKSVSLGTVDALLGL